MKDCSTKIHENRAALRVCIAIETFVLLLFSVEKAIVPKVYGTMHVSNWGITFKLPVGIDTRACRDIF